ncbi:MAG TPA: CHAT domain-containing protein [bacterium]
MLWKNTRTRFISLLFLFLFSSGLLFAGFDFDSEGSGIEDISLDTLTSSILPDTSLTSMVINAVEQDEWQAIIDSCPSLVSSSRLSLLLDSLKFHYAPICSPRLLDKVTADFCNGLAMVLAQSNFPEPSLYFFAKSCSVCYKYDYPEGIIANLMSQATVQNALGRKPPAVDKTVEALKETVELDSMITPQAENLIPLMTTIGDLSEITARLDSIYAHSAQSGSLSDRNLGRVYFLISFAYAEQESLDQAVAEINKSVEYLSRANLPYEEVTARFTKANILIRRDPANRVIHDEFGRMLVYMIKNNMLNYTHGVLDAWVNLLKQGQDTKKVKDAGIVQMIIDATDGIASQFPDDRVQFIADLTYVLATEQLFELSQSQRLELLEKTLIDLPGKPSVFRSKALMQIAQIYTDRKKPNISAQYLGQGLKNAMNDHDWQNIETFYKLMIETKGGKAIADSIAGSNGEWSKAALKTINRSDLENALENFTRLGDTLAQARVNLELGLNEKWSDNPSTREAEAYFWKAYFLALAGGDTSLAMTALDAALEDPYEPAGYFKEFKPVINRTGLPPLFTIRNILFTADRLANDAEAYYEEASSIFEGCCETAALLEDPHGDELAGIRIMLDSNLGRSGIHVAESAESLLTRSRFNGLLSYFDAVYRTGEMIGADDWSLNYYSEMKGYANLGWADLERSLANRQYELAVSRLKLALGQTQEPNRLPEYFTIFNQLAAAYNELQRRDSLIISYNGFQEIFKGRTYRGITDKQKQELHNILTPAYEYKKPELAALIKYDCIGFGDRAFTVTAGGKLGAAIYEDRIGKPFPKYLISGNLLMPRIAVRARFNYLEVVPTGWSMTAIDEIAGYAGLWKNWLSRDQEQIGRWTILETAQRIELGQFNAAESLLRQTDMEPHTMNAGPWTAAVISLLRSSVNEFSGKYDMALSWLDQAAKAGGFKNNEYFTACVNGSAGNIYYLLGDSVNARASYLKAADAVGNHEGQPMLARRLMISLGNLALFKAVAGKDRDKDIDTAQVQIARQNYEAALQVEPERIDPATEVSAHVNLAVASQLMGKTRDAQDEISTAIDTASVYGLSLLEASARVVSGYLDAGAGDPRTAQQEYESAINTFRAAGDRYSLGNALCLLGITHRRLNEPEQALACFKESIEIFESLRTGVNSGDLAASFTAANIDRYAEIIDLLMELGRDTDAFAYVEQSQSKNLRDAFDIDRISPSDTALAATLRKAGDTEKKLFEQEKQLALELRQEPQLQDTERIINISSVIAGTKAEFLSLENKIRQLNPDYEALIKITPGQLAKVQKLLPKGAGLVEYYPAIDNLYIFMITKDAFKTWSVATERDSVYALVRKFRAVMEEASVMTAQGIALDTITTWQDDGTAHYRESVLPLKKVCIGLYDILIAPVIQELAGVSDVIIIPTGLLTYLPFHALGYESSTGFRFFIEDKNVSYLSSAELIDIASENQKSVKPTSLLGFADPDGSLPSADKEVEMIKPIFPRSAVFTKGEATEERAAALSGQYNILHCATHAILNERAPDESYILLAPSGKADGRWAMNEIFGVAWDKMDLVVLSACETALGEKDPGREVSALSYAFSVAGSPSIVASLWPVCDPSTQAFMQRYYRNFKKNSKTGALRAAQVSLLKDPRYAHPFFWAPFVLLGDWR